MSEANGKNREGTEERDSPRSRYSASKERADDCTSAFNMGLFFGVMIGVIIGMSVVVWILMNGVL